MELLQLRYFRDAARYQNFSEVAKIHSIPQSYVSKTIKKLETELGVRLFDRNGRHVSLNDNGKLFLSKIDNALKLIDEGIAEFSKDVQVNISLYVQAGNRFYSLITADFMDEHKNILISAIYHGPEDNTNISYDFTFIQKENIDNSLSYRELLEDEIKVAVHKDLPLASKECVSIKDLKDEHFIGYFKTIGIRAFTDNYCMEHGFSPNVVYETSDAVAFSYMLQRKKGIALVPATTWSFSHTENIVLVPLKEKVARTLAIAWDKNKKLSSVEKVFLDYAVNWFDSIK